MSTGQSGQSGSQSGQRQPHPLFVLEQQLIRQYWHTGTRPVPNAGNQNPYAGPVQANVPMAGATPRHVVELGSVVRPMLFVNAPEPRNQWNQSRHFRDLILEFLHMNGITGDPTYRPSLAQTEYEPLKRWILNALRDLEIFNTANNRGVAPGEFRILLLHLEFYFGRQPSLSAIRPVESDLANALGLYNAELFQQVWRLKAHEETSGQHISNLQLRYQYYMTGPRNASGGLWFPAYWCENVDRPGDLRAGIFGIPEVPTYIILLRTSYNTVESNMMCNALAYCREAPRAYLESQVQEGVTMILASQAPNLRHWATTLKLSTDPRAASHSHQYNIVWTPVIRPGEFDTCIWLVHEKRWLLPSQFLRSATSGENSADSSSGPSFFP